MQSVNDFAPTKHLSGPRRRGRSIQTLFGCAQWGKNLKFESINIREKLARLSEHWKPKIIAQMNDYHFKVVKFQGEFVWHKHDDTDEVFIVLDGEMSIAFEDDAVALKTGEMFVVPKGAVHKPMAEDECQVMLVELAGTVNTGNAGGEMTAENDVWI